MTKPTAALVGPAFDGAAIEIEIDGERLRFAPVVLGPPPFDPTGADVHRVLVEKRAVSCSYRDRAILRHFHRRLAATGGIGCGFGSECVAEVVAVGAAVTAPEVGERVMTRCSYPRPEGSRGIAGVPSGQASSRYEVLPAANLAPVPPALPEELAAGLPIVAQTVFGMIGRLPVAAGGRALVTAGRSVTSQLAIQLLAQGGMTVTAVTRSAGFEERLRALGAERVVRWSSLPELGARLLRERRLRGAFALAFDPFADVYVQAVLPALRLGGSYLTCGFAAQGRRLEEEPRVARIMASAIAGNLTLHGHCLGGDADLEAAIAALLAGRLRLEIDSVSTLEELDRFLHRTFCAPDRFGKAVLVYDGASASGSAAT